MSHPFGTCIACEEKFMIFGGSDMMCNNCRQKRENFNFRIPRKSCERCNFIYLNGSNAFFEGSPICATCDNDLNSIKKERQYRERQVNNRK